MSKVRELVRHYEATSGAQAQEKVLADTVHRSSLHTGFISIAVVMRITTKDQRPRLESHGR